MKMLKIAAKGLAGVALAALLAMNVQVGRGVNTISKFTAEAGLCPAAREICAWGKYPDEKFYHPIPGKRFVVTPELKEAE